MRFLALQTSSRQIRKQFITGGEEELLSRRRHIFAFLFPMLRIILVTLAVLAACISLVYLDNSTMSFVSYIFIFWAIIFLYQTLKAWIAWRYNFLIITTEKIVIVNHISFLHQEIHPIHIEDIRSTRTESQFFGIGNCGTLCINLEEKVAGSSEHVCVSYLPMPAVIVSMIENAVVLKKQRMPMDKGPEAQQQKVEEVKEIAAEAMKKE